MADNGRRMDDRIITNLETFEAHTTEAHALAGLYAFLKLDVLVEAARKISLDFFARPETYRDADVANVSAELAKLHARYGCHEHYLSCDQRRVIFASLFGGDEVTEASPAGVAFPGASGLVRSADTPLTAGRAPRPEGYSVPPTATAGDTWAPDGAFMMPTGTDALAAGDHRFAPERDQLLAASAAFAERVYDTGNRPLRDTVGVMLPGFKSYLEDLNHAMVQWVRGDALRVLTEETSYKILRNPGVARAFGLEPPSNDWPYHEEPNGTTLVARIEHDFSGKKKDMNKIRGEFIDQQRLALRGAEAIATVIDSSDADVDSSDLDLLVSKCYTWYAARGRALGLPLATIAVVPGTEASAAVVSNRRLFGATRDLVS